MKKFLLVLLLTLGVGVAFGQGLTLRINMPVGAGSRVSVAFTTVYAEDWQAFLAELHPGEDLTNYVPTAGERKAFVEKKLRDHVREVTFGFERNQAENAARASAKAAENPADFEEPQ